METSALIEWGGLLLVLALVFAETGLLLGLIIPGGETLVFTAGILASTGTLNVSIVLFLGLMLLAAILGDCSGFYIGSRLQRKIYHKKDTWFFKKKYLHQTENYLKKHQKKALILGKFVPLIRPFVSLLAGVTNMAWSRFLPLSLLANSLYISLFLLAGFFLGSRFPVIKQYLWVILPATVLLLVVPVLLQFSKGKKKTG
jgi:membrane-associated protein